MEEKKRHLVVGAGEVGKALSKVLGCDVRDLDPHEGQYDVLHIAFPCVEGHQFMLDVLSYQAQHEAGLAVIHSTVPPWIFDEHPGWVMSPVRGRHPHLEDGIRAFVKHFGGLRAGEAAEAFRHVGVTTWLHKKAQTLALAKLVELAQFGVEVAMMKEIEAICREQGVPFHEVYRQFGSTYNAGYDELGEHRFHKPVLEFNPGPIGGHCVSENLDLLPSTWFRHTMWDATKQGWEDRREDWR